MGRKRVQEQEKPKFLQPGFTVQEDVWFRMKELALQQRRKVGELMREVMADYLERHGE